MLQIAAVEVPEEYMGSVVELLGKRRGQMVNMEASGFVPYFHCFIRSLVKCLIIIYTIFGFRKQKAIRTVAIIVMIHQKLRIQLVLRMTLESSAPVPHFHH